jgi:hypothetical protein
MLLILDRFTEKCPTITRKLVRGNLLRNHWRVAPKKSEVLQALLHRRRKVRQIWISWTNSWPWIERLRKMSFLVLHQNFPVDIGHSEGDSVKFASPKSGFPYTDEDIKIFSWNVALHFIQSSLQRHSLTMCWTSVSHSDTRIQMKWQTAQKPPRISMEKKDMYAT